MDTILNKLSDSEKLAFLHRAKKLCIEEHNKYPDNPAMCRTYLSKLAVIDTRICDIQRILEAKTTYDQQIGEANAV